MTAGLRCDGPGCRTFSAPAAHWLYLMQQPDEPPIMAALGINRTEPLTFCSPLCVANFCYVLAMTAGHATGTEPPPRSGIGWPQP